MTANAQPFEVKELNAFATDEEKFLWRFAQLEGPWCCRPSSEPQQQQQQKPLQRKDEKPVRWSPVAFQKYMDYFVPLVLEETRAALTGGYRQHFRNWRETDTVTNGSASEPDSDAEPQRRREGESGGLVLWDRDYATAPDHDFAVIRLEPRGEAPVCNYAHGDVLLLSAPDACVGVLSIVEKVHTQKRKVSVRLLLPHEAAVAELGIRATNLGNVLTQQRVFVALQLLAKLPPFVHRAVLDPAVQNSVLLQPSDEGELASQVAQLAAPLRLQGWMSGNLFNLKQLYSICRADQMSQYMILVQGPPGTGKTSTIVGIASAMMLHNSIWAGHQQRMLICSPSNAGVDEILRRLTSELYDELGRSYAPAYGKVVRVGPRTSMDPALRSDSVESVCHQKGLKRLQVLKAASIVCCTLSGAGSDIFDLDDQEKAGKFDSVIVDEAGQAVEPETLIAFTRVKNDGKVILIGDPKQLPATVLQHPSDAYERSMFERLQEGGAMLHLLTQQYRMRPDIARFPSAHFYGGQLEGLEEEDFWHFGAPMLVHAGSYRFHVGPYRFLHVPFGRDVPAGQEHSGSRLNETEAAVVLAVLRGLAKVLGPHFTTTEVGVITPYAAQRLAILNLLRTEGLDDGVEVDTVDAFQGREKDVVIMSCVRSQWNSGIGFVADARRTNVALTRAKQCLLIIGNGDVLAANCSTWRDIVEDTKARGCYGKVELTNPPARHVTITATAGRKKVKKKVQEGRAGRRLGGVGTVPSPASDERNGQEAVGDRAGGQEAQILVGAEGASAVKAGEARGRGVDELVEGQPSSASRAQQPKVKGEVGARLDSRGPRKRSHGAAKGSGAEIQETQRAPEKADKKTRRKKKAKLKNEEAREEEGMRRDTGVIAAGDALQASQTGSGGVVAGALEEGEEGAPESKVRKKAAKMGKKKDESEKEEKGTRKQGAAVACPAPQSLQGQSVGVPEGAAGKRKVGRNRDPEKKKKKKKRKMGPSQ